LDRCLGCRDVAGALRAAGHRVEVHRDHFAAAVEDHVWLPAVGKRGWVILSKDKSFRRRQIEIAALMRSQTATFVLTSGNSTSAQNADAFLKAMPQMLRFVEHVAKPVLAQVTRSGAVQLVLTFEMMAKSLGQRRQ
jgi:hypothetical protein